MSTRDVVIQVLEGLAADAAVMSSMGGKQALGALAAQAIISAAIVAIRDRGEEPDLIVQRIKNPSKLKTWAELDAQAEEDTKKEKLKPSGGGQA